MNYVKCFPALLGEILTQYFVTVLTVHFVYQWKMLVEMSQYFKIGNSLKIVKMYFKNIEQSVIIRQKTFEVKHSKTKTVNMSKVDIHI